MSSDMIIAGLENLGETLKKRRKALGLSQDALADKSGITQAQVSSMERGANIRTATTVAVFRSLGLEMVFVPREFVPALEAMTEKNAGGEAAEKPLYALEEED